MRRRIGRGVDGGEGGEGRREGIIESEVRAFWRVCSENGGGITEGRRRAYRIRARRINGKK